MMFPQTYEINELRITQTTAGKRGGGEVTTVLTTLPVNFRFMNMRSQIV